MIQVRGKRRGTSRGVGEQRTRRILSLAADGQEEVSAKAGREQPEEQQRKTQLQQAWKWL